MVYRSRPGKNERRGGSRRRRTNSWSKNERPKPGKSRSDAERVREVPTPSQRSSTILSTSSDSQLHNGPYRYHTLNHAGQEQQFRLLTLYSGSGVARITCTLTTTNLRNPHRPYVALSYVWAGAPNSYQQPDRHRHGLPLNHIGIDGFQVFVEDNLYNALHHLRSPNGPRVFWIDRLCINQDSLEERRHQVGLMKSIYENARLVIAWIGGHEQGSLRVMTLADRIFREQNASQRHLVLFQALQLRNNEFCDSYRAFFARSYWHRSWIIQEIFSASRLKIKCCGTTIPWDALVVFQRLITEEFFGRTLPDQRVSWGKRSYINRP
ncbi:heterokaryon incompatibility protein-domain-containing protein [Leptodontidium sp. 2 PMI_412]|nr:heterokaryon incompatibility protein-domain-containing protein [Leptodontidium sp. 2 PMI_412]